VDAFGLVALTDGCRWAGLEEEGAEGGGSGGEAQAEAPAERAAQGSGPKA
jgi:hypothetical protein